MPGWLIWAVLIVIGVAAGWAWSDWRQRSRRPARPGKPAPTRPRGRSTAPPRPRDRTRPGKSRPGAQQPGEIWWADVPYEDGPGSKVRPCLVLRADRDGADILKITSQDKSERTDHVQIPTKSWDPGADHDSFLDLTDPIRVPASAFEDRAGTCDPALWQQVRKLHGRTAGR
jgi:hypothetical protein